MTLKSAGWTLIGKLVATCIAGGGIALLYRSSIADIGGVLVLSAILVTLITFVRSGAVSARWLALRDKRSITRLGHLELAKAFACAGLGIDVFRGIMTGIRHGLIPVGAITWTILLSASVVSAMGAGLFLVRWFAAYLIVRRQ